MNFVLTELSNYIICLFMGLYLIESIWPLFVKEGDLNHSLYIRQCIYIIAIYTVGIATLLLNLGDKRYAILYFAGLTVMLVANRLCCIVYRRISRMLLNHMCLFLAISFIILSRISYTKALRQLIIVSFAVAIFIAIPYFIKKFKHLNDYFAIYGAVGFIMLVTVLSIGKSINGSKLSFSMFGLTFQPSEFVKILFVMFIAGLIYENATFIKILISSILAAVFVFVLVFSTDLGSALIFYLAFLVMIFAASNKIIYPIIGLGVGSMAAIFAASKYAHVMTRIAAWKDPWTDIDRTGYQLSQSLFGIGTGNWFGMGLGKGEPSTIPFVDEDFIYSAISEEMGSVFGIMLLLMFLTTSALIIKIAARIENQYYKVVLYGFSTIFITQAILTIGGGTRFIPLTGVTLPLISNGGSSAMSMIMIFGIIQGAQIFPKKKKKLRKSKTSVNGELRYGNSNKRRAVKENAYDNNQNYYNDNFGYDDMDSDYDYDESFNEGFTAKLKKIINPNPAFLLPFINLIIVVFMIINISKFLIVDRIDAINNSYNSARLSVLESENYRGNIYASDGSLLAETLLDKDGTEHRSYPYGNLFSHVVGYSTYGKYGIEDMMNIYLITTNIDIDDKIANDMKGIKNPGNNVYTTLDPKLQQVASDSLGQYRGAVIVTEAKTGKILAMVSKPDFDPNSISSNMAAYNDDSESTVLLNRVTNGLYPPGSTFKIITSLEYIRENPDTYNNYSFTCNGSYSEDGSKIKCYHGSVHGHVDLDTSFAKSCNSSFAHIGLGLNRDSFVDTALELYFNQNIPVDFDCKPSHISIGNDLNTEEMMQTSIGQGHVLITPLHLNMITLAIANDGKMLKPYMVDHVENANGKNIKTFKSEEIAKIMSEDESDELTHLMIGVVENGTAKKISGYGFTCAGKTGSAEFKDSSSNSHAWFTGFAPAEDPEIVVTVIIENIGSGGDYSAPIARRIFTEYFSN